MKQIPLTRGKVALVDDEDYEELSKHKWQCDGKGYAFRTTGSKPRRHIFMARLVMEAPHGSWVDHIDHNTLNNQKSNLRFCNRSESSMNQCKRSDQASSKFKGVHWCTNQRRWIALIYLKKKRIHIGSFRQEEDAARAYDSAAVRLFGKFAYPNFQGRNAE